MPGIREYNQKIGSLKSTKKITSAMKMIAATKLRRAQRVKEASVPYNNSLQEILRHLSRLTGEGDNLLLSGHNEVRKIHAVVFTSDRGLCGSFNQNAAKRALLLIDKVVKGGKEISLSFAGRRGKDYLGRRGYEAVHYYEGVAGKPSFEAIEPIARDLLEGFRQGEFQEAWLVYNEFVSALSQRPVAERILPMQGEGVRKATREEAREAQKQHLEYILEPPAKEFLNVLLPKLVKFQIYHALLDSSASEHGARMTAMDSATGNCTKMTDHYTLLRNRARQAAITTELTEIVAGKEAL